MSTAISVVSSVLVRARVPARSPTATPTSIATRVSSAISALHGVQALDRVLLAGRLAGPARGARSRTSSAASSAWSRIALQRGRGATRPRAGPPRGAPGSLSACTAASISASEYSRRGGTGGHHTVAMAARPDLPLPRRRLRLQALGRRPATDRRRPAAPDRPARARRPPTAPTTPASSQLTRRPRDRADRRLLHADRRRPVRVRPHRRHQRALGRLRDGRPARVGAEPRRLPARDARRRTCCARSCAAAPTPWPRPAPRSSAGTRSTTRSPSTGWR